MIRKLAVVGVVVAGVVALTAGAAFAHAEIEREGEVTADGVVNAVLSMPNESDTAGTTSVVLVFPDSPKLQDAEAEAVAGWTATVQKDAAGDIEQITWTGGPIEGEDEAEFPVTIGDVPEDVDEVDFRAIQTYDDGEIVRWIQPTPEGGEEPDHPAPVLLVRGDASAHDDSDGHDDDGLSTGAIIAIVLGAVIVIAVIILLVNRARRNRRTA